jgi:hypothetical protein
MRGKSRCVKDQRWGSCREWRRSGQTSLAYFQAANDKDGSDLLWEPPLVDAFWEDGACGGLGELLISVTLGRARVKMLKPQRLRVGSHEERG